MMNFTQDQISTIGFLLVGILIGVFLTAFVSWIISCKLMSISSKSKRALYRLIEILKRDLINKQPISVARIYRLIRSVGRREGVKLTMYIAPEVPVEDVELAIKEDEKLDLPQKEECILQIEKILEEMTGQKRLTALPIELSELIKSLKEKLQKGVLEELGEELVKLQLWYETTDFGKKSTNFRIRVVAALMLILLVWISTGVVTFFSVFPQGYNWWTGWVMIVTPVVLLLLFALGYFNVWKDQDKI
ncbi:MAG: hypothetical protein ABIF11_04160 [Nitrospirota bacterium]